jgi:site-specific recombinase XerC
VLAAISDTAVRDRRILANPARGVSVPRKVKRAHTYLSREQVELLARDFLVNRRIELSLNAFDDRRLV